MKTKTSSQLKSAIKEIMKDGEKRDITAIKQELEKKGMVMDEDYNSNHISGVLNNLKSNGYLSNPERGYYQRAEENENELEKIYFLQQNCLGIFNNNIKNEDKDAEELKDEVRKRLKENIAYITEKMKNFDYSKFTSEGFLNASEVAKIKETLEKLVQD